jgi:NAD(P)H-dependent FMN reductase
MSPHRLVVITASTRAGRIGPVVARWFARQAERRHDVSVDPVDLLDGPLPPERVACADAVVIVTPEYNHSFPGPLKTAIDELHGEWCAMPVGFVSYGGLSGGLRAVEQLRVVFAELHAVTIRETVSFHGVHLQFGGEGELKNPAAAEAAAHTLLEQLTWWSDALRVARVARPYPV